MFFDPRDLRCKAPFGAVPCGGSVAFTLLTDDADNYIRCELLADDEFAGTRSALRLAPVPGGFSGTYTAPATGTLVWYGFRLTGADGRELFYDRRLLPDEALAAPWQLTVYADDTASPDWFGQGVTYQIFPDRFCRLSVPDPAGLLGGRVVHRRWEDTPVFLPDGDGQIRNCDFFGGSLQGIISKLDYLASLSVRTVYLNPIFTAASNHRYDTADYRTVDPMLGTEEDLRTLCAEAEKRGIRVMLDGVFNHTGSDSLYFNANGSFPGPGAAQSRESPYFRWYTFHHWPDDYEAWWGIRTLPAVNESDPEYRQFIISDEDSVVRRWLRCGASAWRLDVADELPDDFIAQVRSAMTEEKPDSFLLGEVWEDASNKISYSCRRRYLLGRQLDGVMNYPFRTAVIDWLRGGDAAAFRETMETLRENYPPGAYRNAMNSLGTHDTPRILTVLGASSVPGTKEQRAAYRLSEEELCRGRRLLRLALLLLYCFPGSPTIYYGDEAGMQGFEDPLNRGTYPWGGEDAGLLALYRRLGHLRSSRPSLWGGGIEYLHAQGGLLALRRFLDGETTLCALNAGAAPRELSLPWDAPLARDHMTGQQFLCRSGRIRLRLPPLDGVVLV